MASGIIVNTKVKPTKIVENHNCAEHLRLTDNIITTDTNISYKVYICEECKRYFIKRFNRAYEIEFDYKINCWTQCKGYIDLRK